MIDPTFHLPRAILFDMDGTLTEPMLDFPRIRADMGIAQGPILESLAQMDEPRRARPKPSFFATRSSPPGVPG